MVLYGGRANGLVPVVRSAVVGVVGAGKGGGLGEGAWWVARAGSKISLLPTPSQSTVFNQQLKHGIGLNQIQHVL